VPAAKLEADVTFADIVAARRRIASGVFNSPCVESPALSALVGAHIHCKLEYEQRTGSFKERGACNALLLLPEEARARAAGMLYEYRPTEGVDWRERLTAFVARAFVPRVFVPRLA